MNHLSDETFVVEYIYNVHQFTDNLFINSFVGRNEPFGYRTRTVEALFWQTNETHYCVIFGRANGAMS